MHNISEQFALNNWNHFKHDSTELLQTTVYS